MNRILVLGYFGYKTNRLNGQTVKTRDIYRLVTEQTNGAVDFYDTEEAKYNKFSLFKMFWKLMRCDELFYLPAHNNLKNVFPIVYCLSLIFCFKIHYFVIGGWLREFISELPLHRFLLSRISGIYAETLLLKNELEEFYNYKNVYLFPNFRFFEFNPSRTVDKRLRLVFMARINVMKGLDWIFHLADCIKTANLEDKFLITFYGPINEPDREFFEENVRKYAFVEYKGVLQPNEIHATLNFHDAMLLPTHYYTEGLPGSIVDAYISGIPVVVSEWKHAAEFVEDGVSGYIVPFNDGKELFVQRVMELQEDRTLLEVMQRNALIKREEFAPPQLWMCEN